MNSIIAVVSWLSRQLSVLAGFITGIITLVICIEVTSRLIFDKSIPGASELAILMLTALIFLGLPGAEANGENFSVAIISGRLGRWWKIIISSIVTLFSFMVIVLLAYFSWLRAIESVARGEASYGVIAFPVWPGRLIVAAGLSLLALQLIANLALLLGPERTSDD